MKKIIFLCLSLAMVCHVHAQYEVTDLKKDLREKINKTTSFNGTEYDYVYLCDVADAPSQIQGPSPHIQYDAIVCIDKNGKAAYEMSLFHPTNAEFVTLFEGDDHLLLIYRKNTKKVDSILVNKVEKRNISPAWKPESLMAVRASSTKRVFFDYSLSPNKSHLVVGESISNGKKKPQTLQVAVLDRHGKKKFEQIQQLNYAYKSVSYTHLNVNNDGLVYFSILNSLKKNIFYPSDFTLYTLNGSECKDYIEKDEASKYELGPQSHRMKTFTTTTSNGDLLIIGTQNYFDSNLITYHFDLKNQRLHAIVSSFDTTTKKLVSESFWKMSASNTNRDFKWYDPCGIYELDDESYVLLHETEGLAYKEEQKTTAHTTTDKNGKTTTYYTTSTEYSNYNYWSGSIVLTFLDKNFRLTGFKVCQKHQHVYAGKYASRIEDLKKHLYHKSYLADNGLKLLYHIEHSKHSGYWYLGTIEKDKKELHDNIAIDDDKANFEIRNVEFISNDYWVVLLYGKKKKDRSLSVIHFRDEKDSHESIDTSDEAPELD
jgi:hypothetical protein